GAAAYPQRADQAHEGPGLRQGLPVRARRGRRLRGGRELLARRHAGSRMVPADQSRAGGENRGAARRAAPHGRGSEEQEMIDLQLLRSDLDGVAKRLATRAGYVLDTDRFRELEARRKDIQTQAEKLQAERNQLAKQIGQAKGKGEDAAELLGKAEQVK